MLSFPIRVYIEDTDAGGIVYYVNYLKFMERSRTEFFRALGYHKPAILDAGLLLVVHSAQIDYRRAARLDDELQVTSSITKLARTYVEFNQQVFRGGELLCSGNIRIACVDGATANDSGVNGGKMKPRALPAEMHQRLTQFIKSQSQG